LRIVTHAVDRQVWVCEEGHQCAEGTSTLFCFVYDEVRAFLRSQSSGVSQQPPGFIQHPVPPPLAPERRFLGCVPNTPVVYNEVRGK
jgi:hypothetical protein